MTDFPKYRIGNIRVRAVYRDNVYIGTMNTSSDAAMVVRLLNEENDRAKRSWDPDVGNNTGEPIGIVLDEGFALSPVTDDGIHDCAPCHGEGEFFCTDGCHAIECVTCDGSGRLWADDSPVLKAM